MDELERTLAAALAAVQAYVAAHERSRAGDLAAVDAAELRWQAQALHQAVGALEMVELSAEARTVAALQGVLERLAQRPLAADAALVSLVERGVWAVRDQLQRHLGGRALPALALFPTYRDWRQWAQARAHPADLWTQALPAALVLPPMAPLVLGDRVRTHLERLALPLLRDGNVAAAAALVRLAGSLAQAATGPEARRFWAIAAAVLEGVAAQRLPLDVWVKRALAALLRQVASTGWQQAPAAVWDATAHEWLYLAARLDPPPDAALPHAAALWQAMGWREPLRWDPERRALGLVDPQAVVRAQAAADSAQRQWEVAEARQRPQPPTQALAELADALAALPAPWPALAQAWRQWAVHAVQSDAVNRPSEAVLVLLGLQAELDAFDALDAQQAARVQALADRLLAAADGREVPPAEPWLTERFRAWSARAGAHHWVAEWRAELASLEAMFDALWRHPDPAAWDAWQAVPERLRRLQSHAAVMDAPDVARALAAVEATVADWLRAGQWPEPVSRQMAAQRIGATWAALGAWLDTWLRQPEQAARAYVFDTETGVLRARQAAAHALRAEPSPATMVEAEGAASPAVPVIVSDAAADGEAAAADDFDERAVFLDEARELLAALAPLLDALRAQPDDAAALARVRRFFHTLKGSARLVGLEAIGEAAWRVERCLNAWLAESRVVSVADCQALARTQALLSDWVAAWTDAPPPGDEPARLAAVSELWTAGETPVTPSTETPAPSASPPAPEPVRIGPLSIDPELYAVFLQEADTHSLALEQALADWARGASVDLATAALHAHALAGQSATVGHRPLATLAQALEDALQRAAARAPVMPAERAVVVRAAAELRELLHQMAAGCYREPAAPTLAALADWPPPAPAPPEPEPELEPDVQAAQADFQIEMAQLLPRLRAALARWLDGSAPDGSTELLRLLHTVKGSARLAGRRDLADAAHALESDVLAAPPDGPPPAVLQHALADWIDRLAPAQPATPAATQVAEATVADAGSPAREPPPRAPADLIDRLFGGAADQMVHRQRLAAELTALRRGLREIDANVERLRLQWRELQQQTESRMPPGAVGAAPEGFDALELERYTRVQELTRLLAEAIDDVATVGHQMQRSLGAAEGHLAAQERQAREEQRLLLEARRVPFDSVLERLGRGVHQMADALGRRIDWQCSVDPDTRLDRRVLERVVPVLEHLLRNAVVHGIEPPDARVAAGKPAAGRLALTAQAHGQDLLLTLTDDGAGLDVARLRERAVALGLHPADAPFGREDAVRCAFAPGLSTAARVDAWAGRGIGLDVVRTELEALGGRIEGFEPAGGGTGWRLVVPLTTAIMPVVLVRVDGQVFGLPAPWVDAVRRVLGPELTAAESTGHWREGGSEGGALMPLYWMGALLGTSARPEAAPRRRGIPVLECHSAGQRAALRVDAVLGRQTMVLPSLPPLLARQPGLVGASAQPDGSVVLVYHPLALVAHYGDAAQRWAAQATVAPPRAERTLTAAPLVLVVDDSITVRRVTQRLLQRAGYRVALAGDGWQALQRLREETPVVVLCDIEMPRMDGFELVRALRNDPRWADVPVVMITSRLADKHRVHAEALGVNHYLGKPYADDALLALVAAHARLAAPVGRDLSPA